MWIIGLLLSAAVAFIVKKGSMGVKTHSWCIVGVTFALFLLVPSDGVLHTGVHYLLLSNLLIIAFIDGYTQTILDASLLTLAAFSVLATWPVDVTNVLGFLWGIGFYGSIYWGARWVYKREAFGSGDVYLMAIMGFYLGWPLSLLASLLSFYIALIIVVLFTFIKGRKWGSVEIAFGPYIVAAVVLAEHFGQRVMEWYLFR
ncbi:prepilin peptidase [Fusibacter sp. JL298sf-3]